MTTSGELQVPLKGPLLMQYLFELGKKYLLPLWLPPGDALTFSAPLLVCILHVVFELLQATSCLRL
jgi:hypothetical protein